jgi:hypothetical protein
MGLRRTTTEANLSTYSRTSTQPHRGRRRIPALNGASEIDVSFAKHELRESELMKSGMSYEEAHTATLKEQGMYHREYEKKLYTKEALKAGDDALRNQ